MIKLSKEKYSITKATLEKVLETLSAHWFESVLEGDSAEEFNNEDIIDAQNLLEREIALDNREGEGHLEYFVVMDFCNNGTGEVDQGRHN